MVRGRKPIPTAMKLITGNPGKRPLNKNEPKPDMSVPEAPPHLDTIALAEWNELAKRLNDMGILSLVDKAAFAAYCQSYSRWVQAEEKLKTEPWVYVTDKGFQGPSPWIGISNRALEKMKAFLSEFGLTPASRSRMVVPEKPKGDSLDDFLKHA